MGAETSAGQLAVDAMTGPASNGERRNAANHRPRVGVGYVGDLGYQLIGDSACHASSLGTPSGITYEFRLQRLSLPAEIGEGGDSGGLFSGAVPFARVARECLATLRQIAGAG